MSVIDTETLKSKLPTRRDERWKYTNLAFLKDDTWAQAEVLNDDELPARSRFTKYTGEAAAEIAIVNGRYIPAWSTSVDGVTVRALKAGEAASGSKVPSVQDDIGLAFAADTVVIEIKAGTVLKKPIVVSTLTFGGDSLSVWSVAAPKLIVKVGKHAEAALVEYFTNEGRTLNLSATAIELAPAARLSHARINATSSSGVHLGLANLDLVRDSFCETYQFTLSGRLSREDLNIRLLESGSEAVLDGLYLANEKRHVDHATTVDHIAPQTLSSQLYKGVLADESRAVFNGRVRILRDAQQSNAAQLNNNLLLSKRAEADAKPELEIDADDVKASHGATIGQLDPEHVFYLQARGISELRAKSMLAHGFAQDIAFRVRNESIRAGVEKAVEQALATFDFGKAIEASPKGANA